MKSKPITSNHLNATLLVLVLCLLVCSPFSLQAKENATYTLSLYENPIHQTKALIENSKHHIKAVVYKFELKGLLKALQKAHDRGVRIELVVDEGETDSKKSKVNEAASYGIQVRKWSQGKLHAKFAIFDTTQVMTGSFNWTKAAKNKNVELISYYDNTEAAKKFLQLFGDLWERAAPVNTILKPSTQSKAAVSQ